LQDTVRNVGMRVLSLMKLSSVRLFVVIAHLCL
jgi:hypothetical protein